MKIKSLLIKATMAAIEMSVKELSEKTLMRSSTISNSLKRKRLSEKSVRLIVQAINHRIIAHPEYGIAMIRTMDVVDFEPEGVVDGQQ